MTKTAAIAAIAAAAMPAQDAPARERENYQFELTGGYFSSEIDTNPDLEITQAMLEGTYHFAPVALANHPWNEAAFLEHSMFVTAQLRFVDFGLGAFSADGPAVGAGFRYATKESPVAADVNLRFGMLDGDMGVDVDVTDMDVSVGYWVMSNAIVGIDYTGNEIDIDGGSSIEETSFGIFGKIVHDLGEKRALNAEAHIRQTTVDTGTMDEDNIELEVIGDFYFTPRYGVGALFEISSGDAVSEEGTTFGVRGSAWLTNQVGLRAELSQFWASDSLGSDQLEFALFVDAFL